MLWEATGAFGRQCPDGKRPNMRHVVRIVKHPCSPCCRGKEMALLYAKRTMRTGNGEWRTENEGRDNPGRSPHHLRSSSQCRGASVSPPLRRAGSCRDSMLKLSTGTPPRRGTGRGARLRIVARPGGRRACNNLLRFRRRGQVPRAPLLLILHCRPFYERGSKFFLNGGGVLRCPRRCYGEKEQTGETTHDKFVISSLDNTTKMSYPFSDKRCLS